MPLYDTEHTYEQLKELAGSQRCAACRSALTCCWGGAYGYNGWMLRCTRDARHDGLERPDEARPADVPGVHLTLSTRRFRQLEARVGTDGAKAIQQYANRTALTQQEADHILKLFWPRASADARLKGAMICSMYGLNPLLNHIALMSFRNKDGGTDWAVALGIKANRLLARRGGGFSYLDMTPRAMTEEEQKQVYGKVMGDKIVAITHVKDDADHEAWGYGVWPKGGKVHGEDKGNTPENMSQIHSERQALDRLFPDTMLQRVEVIDERYEVAAEPVDDPNAQSPLWQSEEAEPPIKQIPAREFNNVGELFSACHEDYGLTATAVMAEVNADSPEAITDLTDAWLKVSEPRR